MRPEYALLIAINTKLKALGYQIEGVNTFPRVEVHSLIGTETGEKAETQWAVTGLIDVITQSSAPDSAYGIVNTITTNINESLQVSGYNLYIWVIENTENFEETSDNDDVISRILIRFRVELKKI